VIKRKELREQYAEYEGKLDKLKETAPENRVLEIERSDGTVTNAVYIVRDDALKMEQYDEGDGDGDWTNSITLSGEEAEKLYQFLDSLYG
jgi:hypothetical protein